MSLSVFDGFDPNPEDDNEGEVVPTEECPPPTESAHIRILTCQDTGAISGEIRLAGPSVGKWIAIVAFGTATPPALLAAGVLSGAPDWLTLSLVLTQMTCAITLTLGLLRPRAR